MITHPSPDEVVACIPRDATIVCAGLPMGPQALLRAICRRMPELGAPTIYCGDLSGRFEFLEEIPPEAWGRLRLLVGGGPVPRSERARVDLAPWSVFDTECLIASGRFRVDVCLVTVAPGEGGGYCLSPQVACLHAAAARVPLVLAEVYETLPQLQGDVDLAADRIHAAVRMPGPLAGYRTDADIAPVQRRIAQHVAALIPDGACLQVGIGSMAEAILEALSGHRDLGLHAGFISPGIARQMQAGVINGRQYPLAPGKVVTGALLGDQALFDFAHRHPDLVMRSFSHTNDPAVIAAIPRFFGVNAALAVDPLGQVGAEGGGGQFRAGGGGQMDYVPGAHRSPGGASVIVLPSTAARGTVSRIVAPNLLEGPVTCHRNWVDFVVTEHGVADLRGASVVERAERLVAIADPAWRDQLSAAAATIFHAVQ